MSVRKKRKVFSIEEKLGALERLDRGETAVSLAASLNVDKSTISLWKKNRTKLEQWCASQPGKHS